jgi:hypothetical protein
MSLDPDYSNKPVGDLEFLPLSVSRAIAFMRWTENNPADMANKPYLQATMSQIKLALGDVGAVDTLMSVIDNNSVNPSFLLYMKAAASAAKGEFKQTLVLLKQRMSLHPDKPRFAMPYIAALYRFGRYQQAYDELLLLKPDLANAQQSISKENQYLIAFYIYLQQQLGRAAQVALLTEQLDQWFAKTGEAHNDALATWLVYRGQMQAAQAKLLKIMHDGWLPDINDNLFAESKIRELFVACGLGAAKFDELLQVNRKRVLKVSLR